MKTRKTRAIRQAVVLAAILTLLAAFGATALAANLWGLKDLIFPDRQPIAGRDGVRYVDEISLSGYAESPAAQAHAEWQAFLNTYDVNAAADVCDRMEKLTGHIDPALEKYGAYHVYDQTMAAKFDEILAKYGLNMRGEQHHIDTREDWVSHVGGDFTGSYRIAWGYMFDDGSLFLENEVESKDEISFQLYRSVKTSFTDLTLNITDAAAYEQWHYQTASGEPMLLCLGPTKSLIFGDFPDCFVSVNVLSGTDGALFFGNAIGKADLEALADGLDFSVLRAVRPY